MGTNKLTNKQKREVSALFRQGENKKAISKTLGLGYSTVCKLTSKLKSKQKRGYSINVNIDDYKYIDEFAKKRGMTKNNAMESIVKLAKRKCLFTWG
jgi:transposase